MPSDRSRPRLGAYRKNRQPVTSAHSSGTFCFVPWQSLSFPLLPPGVLSCPCSALQETEAEPSRCRRIRRPGIPSLTVPQGPQSLPPAFKHIRSAGLFLMNAIRHASRHLPFPARGPQSNPGRERLRRMPSIGIGKSCLAAAVWRRPYPPFRWQAPSGKPAASGASPGSRVPGQLSLYGHDAATKPPFIAGSVPGALLPACVGRAGSGRRRAHGTMGDAILCWSGIVKADRVMLRFQ